MSDLKTLIPDFIVKVDGSRIPLEQRALIKEIIITEKLGSPSSFQIRMSDPDLELVNSDDFFIGNEIKIDMGYKDDITQMIHGEITGISSQLKSHSGTSFIIKGHNHLHRLARAKKTMSFIDMTDTDIIKQFANDAGLQSDIEIFEDEHLFTAQNNQTDLQYTLNMAERLDCDIWVDNKKLYFKKQEKNAGEDLILEWKKTLLEFYPKLQTNSLITEVEVRGWNINDGETITGSAVSSDIECTGTDLVKDKFGDQVTVIIDNLVQDSDQADQLALDYLTRQARNYISASGSCEGNKDIRAGTILKINEVGKKLSQKYQVTSVRHVLNINRGYTTYFDVMSFSASAGSSQSTGDQSNKQIFKSQNQNKTSNDFINNNDNNQNISSTSAAALPVNTFEIINLKWKKDGKDVSKANVDDIVEISADVKKIEDNTSVKITVFKKDKVETDDKIDTQNTNVKNKKINIKWKVIYTEDTDDIESQDEQDEKGYTLPEYVFLIECQKHDIKTEKSPILEVKDWIEFEIIDSLTDKPLANADFTLTLADGSKQDATTDSNGIIKIEVPPGKCSIEEKTNEEKESSSNSNNTSE